MCRKVVGFTTGVDVVHFTNLIMREAIATGIGLPYSDGAFSAHAHLYVVFKY